MDMDWTADPVFEAACFDVVTAACDPKESWQYCVTLGSTVNMSLVGGGYLLLLQLSF